jgi:hypothetical protein
VDSAYPWCLYQMRLPDEARRPAFGLDNLTLRHVRTAGPDGETLLQSLPADHLVSDAFEGVRHPVIANLVRSIAREREVRISPMGSESPDNRPFLFRDQNDEYPADRSWAWRMLHARRLGPVVEVHRLR